MYQPPTEILRREDVDATLQRVTFAPSCVDMQWDWQIKELTDEEGLTYFMIRTTFRRPDSYTGEDGEGYGRWWVLNYGCHADALLKTAYMACGQILTNELMEAFLLDGQRPFDPHASLDLLSAINVRFSADV